MKYVVYIRQPKRETVDHDIDSFGQHGDCCKRVRCEVWASGRLPPMFSRRGRTDFDQVKALRR